tara:strand:+ start:3432 stop:3779 length:348 start_codon:yes stop_codon:yes gene_type:complete
MIIEYTNTILKHSLQRNVIFEVNSKIIRQGKIILYNIKDFYISFNILTPKDVLKTYELPVPFEISLIEEGILCDYSISNITRNVNTTDYLIRSIYNKFGKKSKLFNNKLTIKFVE